jgi:hypothetical protein
VWAIRCNTEACTAAPMREDSTDRDELRADIAYAPAADQHFDLHHDSPAGREFCESRLHLLPDATARPTTPTIGDD